MNNHNKKQHHRERHLLKCLLVLVVIQMLRPVVYVWCVAAGLMARTSSAVVASESPTSTPSSGRCGTASQHDDSASLHAPPVAYVWCVAAGLMARTSSAVVASEFLNSSGTDPTLIASTPSSGRCGTASQHDDSASIGPAPVGTPGTRAPRVSPRAPAPAGLAPGSSTRSLPAALPLGARSSVEGQDPVIWEMRHSKPA